MTTTEKIEGFIATHGLTSESSEVINTSKLHPMHSTCFHFLVKRAEQQEIFDVFGGPSVREMSLASALWLLAEDANKYNGLETFERWEKEQDGYYERMLGLDGEKMMYEWCRGAYFVLVRLLGEELYQELVDLIINP